MPEKGWPIGYAINWISSLVVIVMFHMAKIWSYFIF